MAPQVTMWFFILLFGMQMTRGLCRNCSQQDPVSEMLYTILECRPGIFSLFVIQAIITVIVILTILVLGVPCVLWHVWRWKKRRGCRKDNLIQKLKICYSGVSHHEISLTGTSPCRAPTHRNPTCYEDLLTTNDRLHKSRRVLFLGHSEVSQYILREWSNGNILEDQVLIYIKDGEDSCILELVKQILNTDCTDYLLKVLKQIPVIVLVNLDAKRDQVGEKIIDVNQLLNDNIDQFPLMNVWGTSGKESGDCGLHNRDFVVNYGIE